jgi:hypothetical protein
MQSNQSEAVLRLRSQLAPLRGLWLGFEADLAVMGVSSLEDLRGRSPEGLLQDYCQRTARPADPALRPYFEAVVRFSETGEPRPWWKIMREDSARECQRLALTPLK